MQESDTSASMHASISILLSIIIIIIIIIIDITHHMTSENMGIPSTTVSPRVIALSWKNRARVDLLKPCRCSTTKVLYSEKGKLMTVSRRVSMRMNTQVMQISWKRSE